MWLWRTRRVHVVAVVSLLAGALGVSLDGGASGATASKSRIAIHQQGKNDQTTTQAQGAVLRGTFRIELDLTPYGRRGTTTITTSPSNVHTVNGQDQTPFIGTDRLKSAKGELQLAFRGIHIDVNSKLLPSGYRVGPQVEYGTWTIKSATGIYKGWKGGGNWAASLYGYTPSQPYSVEWDGYITH